MLVRQAAEVREHIIITYIIVINLERNVFRHIRCWSAFRYKSVSQYRSSGQTYPSNTGVFHRVNAAECKATSFTAWNEYPMQGNSHVNSTTLDHGHHSKHVPTQL
jgi:hypothetical protein